MSALELDGGYLYWSVYDVHGMIKRLPLAGGTPQTLLTDASFPTRIAVEGANVYWAGGGSFGVAGNVSGGIFKAAIAGGPVTTLASDMLAIHWSLAVQGAFVYWTSYDQGSVNRANLDGSDALTLASGQHLPLEIAVDAEHVYWATLDGTVTRASLDGSDPIPFMAQPCGGLVLDQTSLYCSGFGGQLLRAPLDQSAPKTLGTTTYPQQGAAIAVDAEYAYWGLEAEAPQPILVRVPLAGGPAVTLAPAHENDSVGAVTTSDRCVYWAQSGPGGRSTLFALAK